MVAWISRGAVPVVTFICPLKPSLALLTAAEQLLPELFAREPCRLADKQFLLKASPFNIHLLPKMFGAEPSPFFATDDQMKRKSRRSQRHCQPKTGG